jgi:drug/metabolite transporter (DMT)-like permease
MSPPPAISATADATSYVETPAVRVPAAVRDGTLIAIGLIIASTIFFSAGDIVAKSMTDTMHPLQVTWFRYLGFAIIAVPAVFMIRGRHAFSTTRPRMQLARGLAVCASSALFILGLGHLGVADNTAINYLSPLFITALSIPLLGEKVGARRWAAAFVGFAGVLLVVRPGSDAFQLAALFPVASALVWAFGAIFTRQMADERPETTLAWTAAIGFVVLTVLMPFYWTQPSQFQVGEGLLTGLLSTIGHVLIVLAFRRASASTLAPFSYVQLLFAGLFAFLVFGDMPSSWTIAGCLVIAASGLYTAHRERIRAAAARA